MEIEHGDIVERVAKALFYENVRRARQYIDSMNFDSSDLVDVMERIRDESATAKIIILSSYIEQKTVDLFELNLRDFPNRGARNIIFGRGSAFSTFSSRIDTAYYIGWIDADARRLLHCVRDIRNVFAHQSHKLRIDEKSIKDKISAIPIDVHSRVETINKSVEDHGGSPFPSPKSEEDLFVYKIIYIFGTASMSFLAGSASMRHNIPQESIFGPFDELPEKFKEIRRNMAKSMMVAFDVDDVVDSDT